MLFDPPKLNQARQDLLHAQPQRRGDAEQGANNCSGIDGVPDPAFDPLAVQAAAQATSGWTVGDPGGTSCRPARGQRRRRSPKLQPPVEHGQLHRLVGRGNTFGLLVRRCWAEFTSG